MGCFPFLVALERSKREKLKKLSSVCEKSGSFVDTKMKKGSGASPREEDGVEFVAAAKKLKLPRKVPVHLEAAVIVLVPSSSSSSLFIFPAPAREFVK